jgi:hypothetical protein
MRLFSCVLGVELPCTIPSIHPCTLSTSRPLQRPPRGRHPCRPHRLHAVSGACPYYQRSAATASRLFPPSSAYSGAFAFLPPRQGGAPGPRLCQHGRDYVTWHDSCMVLRYVTWHERCMWSMFIVKPPPPPRAYVKWHGLCMVICALCKGTPIRGAWHESCMAWHRLHDRGQG